MSWKKLPSWIKGGILAWPIYGVIAPVSLFLTGAFTGAQDAFFVIAPEIYYALLSYGLSEAGRELGSVVTVFGVAVLILLIRLFITGAIIGGMYGLLGKRGRVLFVVTLIILYAGAIIFVSHRYQNLEVVNGKIETSSDCTDSRFTSVHNFSETACLLRLAEKKQDLRICDSIREPGPSSSSAEESRGFCYEEVAHVKNDPSICPLIQNVSKKDGCYQWFNMCENISTVAEQTSCFTSRAISFGSVWCASIPKNQKNYTDRFAYCESQAAPIR